MTRPTVCRLSCCLLAALAGGCSSPFAAQDDAYSHFRLGVLEDYRRALVEAEQVESTAARPATIDFEGDDELLWWDRTQTSAMRSETLEMDLNSVMERTLASSTQIQVFSDLPLIRRTGIDEAKGRFVPRFFAEAKYEHTNDAVGSTLQTGGPNRFIEDAETVEVGVRNRLTTGGEVTVSQRISYTDNNSVFFVPDQQARGALTLSLVQPLLKGAGQKYNQSIIQIARIDSEIARQEFVRQAEFHLLETIRAYWALRLARIQYMQLKRLTDETEELVGLVEGRENLDAATEVISRARAALSARRSNLVRAEFAIRNAEDRLRALVNDTEMRQAGELVPVEMPAIERADVDLKASGEAAILARPEIREAFEQWRAAQIRLDMARNESLPTLDLIAEFAVNGLDGSDPDVAFGNQFSRGGPGGLIGLRFEVPFGDAEGSARELRRRLELNQQSSQIRTTLETVLLEVKISVREVGTSYRDLTSRYDALQAAHEELRVLRTKWESGVAIDGVGGAAFLELLLDSQGRLTNAEVSFAEARASYNVALANLQRAQGTLLKYESIEVVEDETEEGLPTLRLQTTSPDDDRVR